MADNNYKPDYADPNKYNRMRISYKNHTEWQGREFTSYLKKYGILNKEQLTESMNKMIHASAGKESSFLQKIGSWIWYRIKPELTPRNLAWLLTHTDKLIPFAKGETFKDILKAVDRMAEWAYNYLDN